MNDFWIWFSTGVTHITDLDGYDHILFVALLVFTFSIYDWKKLLIIITAFTVGHSVSLALSVNSVIKAPQMIVEFLIAFSILVSALHHLIVFKTQKNANSKLIYGIVIFFGLIHGLGFSYLLRAMLGREESLFLPLLYFNFGLEVGQLAIVSLLVVFSLFLTLVLKIKEPHYKFFFVCIIAVIALKMSAERLLLLL